jgi:hypothetical protein
MYQSWIIVFLLTLHLAKANGYQLYEENGKTGLKDNHGNIIIPAQYDALGWSNGTFSIVQQTIGYRLQNLWGLISLSNRLITPPRYAEIIPTEKEILLAALQNRVTTSLTWGGLSPSGKIIIPFVYAGIRMHGSRAITYLVNGARELRYGLTDLHHRIILPSVYQNIYPIGEGYYAVQNTEGKIALFNDRGQALTPFDIDSLLDFQNGVAVFYSRGYGGLIDKQGKIIVPARFRAIDTSSHPCKARLPSSWSILTEKNLEVHRIEADTVIPVKDNRLAILTTEGVWITDDAFRIQHVYAGRIRQLSADQSTGHLRMVSDSGTGILSPDGAMVLPPVFKQVIPAHEVWIGQTLTGSKPQWHLYDLRGSAISAGYDSMAMVDEKFFRVRKNGYEGIIDINGREVLHCVYDRIHSFRQNRFVAEFHGGYGIISADNTWIVPPQPYPIEFAGTDAYLIRQGELQVLKNFKGSTLYFTTNPITAADDGMTEITAGGGRWRIDFNGRIVQRESPPLQPTDWIGESSEGYRPIRRNGRYGFVDANGLLRIPNRYEEVMPFSEGRAGIKIRNKWGFIDQQDHIVVQPVYDKASPFSGGLSIVMQKGKQGVIDRQGQVIVPVLFDSIKLLPTGRMLVGENNLYGLYEITGNQLLFAKYEYLDDLGNGLVIVRQYGKYGVVDTQGVARIPVNYDYLFYHASSRKFIGLRRSEWVNIP